MKPLRLEFGGLQSYRQTQNVDFERLGAAGVFGVFGPTGAGKSTILDAMTLALFGHVNRAARGTMGIINQQESSAQVSFEFELGGARYVVERRYDRAPDPRTSGGAGADGTRCRYARLRRIEPGGAETVLASTPGETDRAVLGLLGLSKEDFYRAVVLPQGKFDEFLRLTGGDRAAMLERILDLGRFGDELARKAADLRDELKAKVDEMQAEQRGLGECTDEAVAGAESYAAEQAALLQGLKARLGEAEARFQGLSRLRDLHLRREAAREKKRGLDARASEMEHAREAVAGAEKAEAVRSLIEQEEALARTVDGLRAALSEESLRLKRADEAFRLASEGLDGAEKRLGGELPGLLQRKAELGRAVEADRKARALEAELRRVLRNLDGWRAESERIALQKAELEEKARSLQAGLDDLQARRSEVVTDPEERDRVESAVHVLQRLEPEEDALREAVSELQSRIDEAQRRWDLVVELISEAYPGWEAPEHCDVRGLADDRLGSMEESLRQAEESLRRAEARSSAALLSRGLRDGEPCPVCGSLEHPHPAEEPGPEVEVLRENIALLRDEIERGRRWRDRVLQGCASWEAAAAEVTRSRDACEARRKRVEALEAEFERLRGAYDRQSLGRRRKQIQANDRVLAGLEKAVREAERERVRLESEIRELDRRTRAVLVEIASAETRAREIERQVREVQDEVDRLTDGQDPAVLVKENERLVVGLRLEAESARLRLEKAREERDDAARRVISLRSSLETSEETLRNVRGALQAGLAAAGFRSAGEAKAAMMAEQDRAALKEAVTEYDRHRSAIETEIARLDGEMGALWHDEEEYAAAEAEVRELRDQVSRATEAEAVARERLGVLRERRKRWVELEAQSREVGRKRDLAETLARLLQGRRLVQFMAEEHLRDMVGEASQRLGRLSGQRYALELAEGCAFVVRDDYNGGLRRAVGTLSGGETFLASLALALALSSKIQLRGRYPLGFFFLDEGFGTLDDEKLELVMSALEKIHDRDRIVGVISHVKELRDRLPHYVEVLPPREDGAGSVIRVRGN